MSTYEISYKYGSYLLHRYRPLPAIMLNSRGNGLSFREDQVRETYAPGRLEQDARDES